MKKGGTQVEGCMLQRTEQSGVSSQQRKVPATLETSCPSSAAWILWQLAVYVLVGGRSGFHPRRIGLSIGLDHAIWRQSALRLQLRMGEYVRYAYVA